MKIFPQLRSVFCALLLVISSAGVSAAVRDINDNRWQAGECPFEVASEFTIGEDVLCGTVSVPERHAQPNGPQITLSVAIFKASDQPSAPDPLVPFAGGPGGNIFALAPRSKSKPGVPAVANRDTVLMSERGTYGAMPFLDCPELAVLDEHFGVWGAERNALEIDAYSRCKSRLVAASVNLDSFNNTERAADVPFVMNVLGYSAYNLWGVSGGGLLTELVVRNHPDAGVRAIMPDSGSFPRADYREVFSVLFSNISDRFRLLFETCAADPVCQAHYPDLERVLFDLIATLNREPASVSATNPDTRETVQISLTGDLLVSLLTGSFGYVSALPTIIYDIAAGNYGAVAKTLPGILRGDSGIGYADGLYLSMICPEIGDMTIRDVDAHSAYPQITQALTAKAEMFFAACDLWGLPTVSLGDVVVSDVPALIMEGAFDTNKMPGYGAEVVAHFKNGYFVEFGDRAHGVFGQCALSLMAQFMDNPTARPDTRCVATKPSFREPPGAQ